MKACFENFIVDDTNRLAYEAAVKFASESSSLLNLSGVIGGGKTHLLRAIQYDIEMNSCRKVELVDGSHLIEQYIEILKTTQHTEYPIKDIYPLYADLDVLLVDDIECLIGKEYTQQVFADFLVAMLREGKSVAFTTYVPVAEGELTKLNSYLNEQQVSYEMVHISEPSMELKCKFLEEYSLSEEEKLEIASSVTSYRNLRAVMNYKMLLERIK